MSLQSVIKRVGQIYKIADQLGDSIKEARDFSDEAIEALKENPPRLEEARKHLDRLGNVINTQSFANQLKFFDDLPEGEETEQLLKDLDQLIDQQDNEEEGDEDDDNVKEHRSSSDPIQEDQGDQGTWDCPNCGARGEEDVAFICPVCGSRVHYENKKEGNPQTEEVKSKDPIRHMIIEGVRLMADEGKPRCSDFN